VYLSLLGEAAVMIGNSSSGLIEAPSRALPVVNIGSRQRGRLRGPNVIDVLPAREDILQGIEAALDPALRERLRRLDNPYGDGETAPRIVKVLREVSLDARLVEKRFPEREPA
jgi:UDP-N-acetylglucosamine 2-epimerase (non-hydrolysing)/GDP/UDP-N,N'-diacetylbacillosamine 2-epimerase (hydrolysing)